MRQADTARDVYYTYIEPTLEARERFVLEHLTAYLKARHVAPTSLELLAYIQEQHPGQRFDCNSVRPRISALVDMGIVKASGKRRCPISGMTVHTWVLAHPDAVEKAPEAQRLQF